MSTRLTRLAMAGLLLVTVLSSCTSADSNEEARLMIGDDLTIVIEYATTTDAQRTGLAGRESLPPGTGMLFPFTEPSTQRVWMGGMQFPIDIAWIRDGHVIATDTLPVCNEPNDDDCPRWESPGDVDALLETTAGTLAGITPGALVTVTRQE